MIVRRPKDTFEEIKFRVALAVTQWEALQEKAPAFKSCVQEAKEQLARSNEEKVTVLNSTTDDASSS